MGERGTGLLTSGPCNTMGETEIILNSCKTRRSIISALKMGGNSCILAGGPGKASYHRNVTVKKKLSGHVGVGGIHIWLL